MRVIVHGGAGSASDEPAERQTVLDRAAERGTAAASPVDAVVAAVRVLESDPRFNAGVGSAVQSDGCIRTDAGVMTGSGSAGAACAMSGVEHAVEVARVVMTATPHVLLAGEHAVDLAAAFDIDTHADLWTDRTRARWASVDPPVGSAADRLQWVRDHFDGDEETRSHDTVGAVASDGDRVATATSTGGRWFALAGRVGDVPQIGSGFYASEAGGASATGAGEDIARQTLARQAVDLLDAGRGPQEAADTAIADFGEAVEGSAGLIVMGDDGAAGSAYNSEAMQTAAAER